MRTEETGKNFFKCYVFSGISQNQCIDMEGMFMASSMKAASWARFLKEFGNVQEHKIREHRECVQHHSKMNERTFWRTSECEKLGLFITVVTIVDEINTDQR